MLPAPELTDCLFLDFDGTLVEIASEPSLIVVPDSLRELLAGLQARLAGAVAIISGRPITDLDRHLAPLRFAAAGEHGAEIRHRPGGTVDSHTRLPAEMLRFVESLARECPGLLVEPKSASVSVHYRNAPTHGAAVTARMHKLSADWPDYELLHGKMVLELKPGHLNKGVAIRSLAAQPPFAGRRPVFIGDDTTDESGFAAVNELEGLTIRVGGADSSQARYRLPDIASVHAWLQRLL